MYAISSQRTTNGQRGGIVNRNPIELKMGSRRKRSHQVVMILEVFLIVDVDITSLIGLEQRN